MKNLSFKNKNKRISKRLNGKKSVKKYKGGDGPDYYTVEKKDDEEYEIKTTTKPQEAEVDEVLINELREQIEKYILQIKELQANIETLEAEKASLTDQLNDAKAEIDSLNKKLEACGTKTEEETKIIRNNYEERIIKDKEACDVIINKLADCEAALKACEKERDELNKLKTELEAEKKKKCGL